MMVDCAFNLTLSAQRRGRPPLVEMDSFLRISGLTLAADEFAICCVPVKQELAC